MTAFFRFMSAKALLVKTWLTSEAETDLSNLSLMRDPPVKSTPRLRPLTPRVIIPMTTRMAEMARYVRLLPMISNAPTSLNSEVLSIFFRIPVHYRNKDQLRHDHSRKHAGENPQSKRYCKSSDSA